MRQFEDLGRTFLLNVFQRILLELLGRKFDSQLLVRQDKRTESLFRRNEFVEQSGIIYDMTFYEPRRLARPNTRWKKVSLKGNWEVTEDTLRRFNSDILLLIYSEISV